MKFICGQGWILLALLTSISSVQAATTSRVVTGDVIANRSVTLSTRIMGRIVQVYATEGEQITSDQVLVELDATEYQAQLRIAQAARERAEAELAHRQRNRTRLQQLTQNNAVSQEAVDEAIYALEIAEANLKVAKAEIEAIQSTLAETRIKAPFDAVVIKKSAEIGLVTQPGQSLYEIQDQSQLRFRARIKERDLIHIKHGDQAQVSFSALGKTPVSARVIKIIPYGDNRHTFLIEMSLPQQNGLLPGMFGKAVFE